MSERCEHCGLAAESGSALDIEHRGCRLKAAFPAAYHEDGALVAFDMDAVRRAIGWREPFVAKSGLKITVEPWGVWVGMPVRYSNIVSEFSFRVRWDEWDDLIGSVAALRDSA